MALQEKLLYVIKINHFCDIKLADLKKVSCILHDTFSVNNRPLMMNSVNTVHGRGCVFLTPKITRNASKRYARKIH